MKYSHLLLGLLSGLFLASCQSQKVGGDGTELLTDNGGYSHGDFYGDSSAPAPAGYPQDGQTFATGGGVPFGHNDPVHLAEPAPPVVADVPVAPAVAPTPAPRSRVAASRPAADPYEEAYSDGDSYGQQHGAEMAVVTPYVERTQPAVAFSELPGAAKPKAGASKTTTKQTTAGTAKKKAPVVAASGTAGKGTTKTGAKKTGTTVKTVYTPPGKGKTATKKKASVVRVHDVKRGDTLSKLASRYGVTVAELKKRNKLASDTIVVGKRLTID